MFKKRSINGCYKFLIIKEKNFINFVISNEKSVTFELYTAIYNKIEENRKKLFLIFRIIFLCGRQNFPLRWHRDDLIHCSVKNERKFKEFLKFRIDSGDDILKNYL